MKAVEISFPEEQDGSALCTELGERFPGLEIRFINDRMHKIVGHLAGDNTDELFQSIAAYVRARQCTIQMFDDNKFDPEVDTLCW